MHVSHFGEISVMLKGLNGPVSFRAALIFFPTFSLTIQLFTLLIFIPQNFSFLLWGQITIHKLTK